MRRVLGMTLGIKGQVKKTRLLFMYGRTRIHVDQVHTLGNFMELEVRNMQNILTFALLSFASNKQLQRILLPINGM